MEDFEAQKPKWSRSLVLICEKCGKKSGDPELALELKNEWKKEFQKEELWGPTRIVVSSCLGVCPEGEIAVARLGEEREVFTFRKKEAWKFLEFLKKKERKTN